MIELDKATDPHCPRCGCNATTLAATGERAGRPYAWYRCSHCKHQFKPSAAPEPLVRYNAAAMQCPSCQSDRILETGRRGDHVYGKCENCGQDFYAREV